MNRDNLLGKIRALMSKTTSNGCTEAEALAALDKARAMMDAYEVTEADLALTKEELAILHRDDTKDPHGIKQRMAVAVSTFCDCKVWRSGKGLVFCGLKSDADLATWLLGNLQSFVQAELTSHLMGSIAPKGERRLIINGFVFGATQRISVRLTELVAKSRVVATSNSTALVVVKGAAIADAMRAAGIGTLRKSRRSSRRINGNSYRAGQSAGERATFGRPVGGVSQGRLA